MTTRRPRSIRPDPRAEDGETPTEERLSLPTVEVVRRPVTPAIQRPRVETVPAPSTFARALVGVDVVPALDEVFEEPEASDGAARVTPLADESGVRRVSDFDDLGEFIPVPDEGVVHVDTALEPEEVLLPDAGVVHADTVVEREEVLLPDAGVVHADTVVEREEVSLPDAGPASADAWSALDDDAFELPPAPVLDDVAFELPPAPVLDDVAFELPPVVPLDAVAFDEAPHLEPPDVALHEPPPTSLSNADDLLALFDAPLGAAAPTLAPPSPPPPSLSDSSAPLEGGVAAEIPALDALPFDLSDFDAPADAAPLATDLELAFPEPEPVEAVEPAPEPAPPEATEPETPSDADDDDPDKPAMHDQVERERLAMFTRQLITTMNRTTYYTPGHPAHFAVREELFVALRELLGDQPQVGYVLLRGNPPVIYVDGLSVGRVKLNETMGSAVYEVFVPRFIEYMNRYELVMIAFRQEISLREFETFVSLMTRPPSAKGTRFSLSDDLLEADVVNMSVLAAEEVQGLDESLPWQVQVCLARLRRDLRMVPLFRAADVATLKRIKRQIFSDVVRPLSDVQQLKFMVLYSPMIEKQLAEMEEAKDIRIAENMVAVLPGKRLIELTFLLVPEMKEAVEKSHDNAQLLQDTVAGCIERLRTEMIPDAGPVLHFLQEQGLIGFNELPEWLQEDILAERYLRMIEHGNREAIPTETARDLRVLGKLARLVFDRTHPEETARLISPLVDRLHGADETLAAVAREMLVSVVPPSELPMLVSWFEWSNGLEQRNVASLLTALGERGAKAICQHISQLSASARSNSMIDLLDQIGAPAVRPIVHTLVRQELTPFTLRALLRFAARHPTPEMITAVMRHVDHPEATLRMAALTAMRTAQGDQARQVFETALHDRDGNVVLMAMSTLAEHYGATDMVRQRALTAVREVEAGSSGALILGAMRVLEGAVKPEERAEYTASLQRILHIHAQEASLIRLGTGKPFDPVVIAAVQASLVRLDAAPAAERASWWDRLRKKT